MLAGPSAGLIQIKAHGRVQSSFTRPNEFPSHPRHVRQMPPARAPRAGDCFFGTEECVSSGVSNRARSDVAGSMLDLYQYGPMEI
jgi:hypothetical protein